MVHNLSRYSITAGSGVAAVSCACCYRSKSREGTGTSSWKQRRSELAQNGLPSNSSSCRRCHRTNGSPLYLGHVTCGVTKLILLLSYAGSTVTNDCRIPSSCGRYCNSTRRSLLYCSGVKSRHNQHIFAGIWYHRYFHSISTDVFRPPTGITHFVEVPSNVSARSFVSTSGKGFVENSNPRVRSLPSHGTSSRDLFSVHRQSHGKTAGSHVYVSVLPMFVTANCPALIRVAITSPHGASAEVGIDRAASTGSGASGAASGNRDMGSGSLKCHAASTSAFTVAPSRNGSASAAGERR